MPRPQIRHIGFPALVALLIVASSTAAAAASPRPRGVLTPAPAPKHMMFRVRGPSGATVYLLGSVHLLTAEASKLPWEVDSAFAHAKTIAFETSIDSMQMRAPEMLGRARLAGGATLRSTLSPAAAAKTDSVLKLYGLTLDQLNGFKPWFVSVAISQLVMQKANFQPQFGVDAQLNVRAKQAGKAVIGLEPVEFQMGLFDTISPTDQERMLMESAGPDSASHVLMRIKDAWLTGSVSSLDSLLNRGAADSPAFFATVVSNRNKSWIPKIEELLKGKDDALVVVGAAHLVGQQGVVELLKAKGYSIEQM